jgi:hypothetical protein
MDPIGPLIVELQVDMTVALLKKVIRPMLKETSKANWLVSLRIEPAFAPTTELSDLIDLVVLLDAPVDVRHERAYL